MTKVQAISTRYTEWGEDGSLGPRHARGDVFELDSDVAKRDIEAGFLRSADAIGEELPPPNHFATDPRPVEPDGTPIDADAEGEPLIAGASGPGDDPLADWKAPRTHKEADKELGELGISVAKDAKLDAKVEAIRSYKLAQAQAVEGAAAPVPFSELDLSTMSEGDLIQLGVDVGLSEEGDLIDLSHDELTLVVAEAVNRYTAGDAAREASIHDDAEARREQAAAE